jgi:acyl-CoA synthetase (AMP-forming)/AMP-acid ligase II/acyl carrier protein
MRGELCLAGDGLARGYLGQPERTAERFVPHPFSQQPGARLYRTGDLVRWRADDQLEFVGRRDQQVKVRGYRIELGEIEAVLRRCPGVQAAAVVVREERAGSPALVGYLVPDGQSGWSSQGTHAIEENEGAKDAEEATSVERNESQPLQEEVTSRIVRSQSSVNEPLRGDQAQILLQQARQYLQEHLPEYMHPGSLLLLEQLPLTSHGKLDTRLLPDPQQGREPQEQPQEPQTPLEQIISEIWEDVLELSPIGVKENFFELGGHSLLATQIAVRLSQQVQVKVPVGSIFEAPTISELARYINQLTMEQEDIELLSQLLAEIE